MISWPELVLSKRSEVAAIVSVALAVACIRGYQKSQPNQNSSPSATKSELNVGMLSPAVMTIYVYRGKDLYAQGSGFLIDDSGTAVTNVHVLKDGDRADVELGDGRKYHVLSITSFDLDQDIALFKVGVSSLPFPHLELGDSANVQIGDKITLISSPEGLNNTVTEGILSARRSGKRSVMQVSAPISPGSSGAPVFDTTGHVVGVAQSQFRSGQNLNFAIPINVVTSLLGQAPMDISMADFFEYAGSQPTIAEEEDQSAPVPT